MNNTSGITLTFDKVLLRPVEIEEKTEGGIIIASQAKQKEDMSSVHGILVDAGPIAWESHELQGIKPGEIVLFSKFSGTEYTAMDGIKYRIIKVGDVLGKTEKVYNPRFKVKAAEVAVSEATQAAA